MRLVQEEFDEKMYISLNWIKEFVNLDGIEVDEIVKRFGLATAEVEGVEYKGQNISNIVVAEIKSVSSIPIGSSSPSRIS